MGRAQPRFVAFRRFRATLKRKSRLERDSNSDRQSKASTITTRPPPPVPDFQVVK